MINRDAGLQPQRTALAWTRTGLAIFVNALLVLRVAVQSGQSFVSLLGVALLLSAAAVVACGAWRRRALMQSVELGSPPTLLMQAVVLVVLLACAAGVASITASLVSGSKMPSSAASLLKTIRSAA